MPGSEDSESLPIPPLELVDSHVGVNEAQQPCMLQNVPPIVDEDEDEDVIILDGPNEVAVELTPNEVIINGFVQQYADAMADYPHLQLGEVDVRARIAALITSLTAEGIHDFRLEDFSAALFAFAEMPIRLNALNLATGNVEGADDRARVSQMVLDLVLFSSLVPTRDYRRKVLGNFSEVSRYSLQVLTPKQVITTLSSMQMQLVNHPGAHIHNASSFQHLNLDGADTLQQRMVKLALMSTPIETRVVVGADVMHQRLLDSPHVAKMLFASTGADEQYFLNTCPISARNTDMASRTSNLITMVHAGEKLIRDLRDEVANGPAGAADRKLTVFQTTGELVTKRCDDAEAVFISIRQELDHMLQNPDEFDYRRVKALRKDWSRTMQKLGGVVNWTERGAIPHLSKKYLKDHYYASGVIATVAALTVNPFMRNTRTFKRPKPPDAGRYMALTMRSVESHAGANDRTMSGVDGGCASLWNQLYKVGGSPFSANSAAGMHSLYIKAIMHDGQRKFAINDPMQRSFAYLNMEQMQAYVAGTHEPRIPNSVMYA